MILETVCDANVNEFQQMAYAYWQEIMPHSHVVKNEERLETYFQERFPLRKADLQLFFGVEDGLKIGFVAFETNEETHSAMIEDFFVVPATRRRGYGTAMVKAIFSKMNQLGMTLVELTVRRDTPEALAFWEAQGFRVALYRLRQYRDPVQGKAYIGGLSSDFV